MMVVFLFKPLQLVPIYATRMNDNFTAPLLAAFTIVYLNPIAVYATADTEVILVDTIMAITWSAKAEPLCRYLRAVRLIGLPS